MKFVGTFVGIKLDLSGYRRRLEDYLVEMLRLGANTWLQVVAGRGGRIPLWSGMARASLLELSQLIDGTIVLTPKKAKSRVAIGRALGTATLEISESKAFLTIITSVPHYTFQEYNKPSKGGSPSAPWRSRQVGAAAFRSAVIDAQLPKPLYLPLKMRIQ